MFKYGSVVSSGKSHQNRINNTEHTLKLKKLNNFQYFQKGNKYKHKKFTNVFLKNKPEKKR